MKKFLLPLFLCLAVISCKKSTTTTTTANIYQLVETWTDYNSATHDTTSVRYQYDTLNRIVRKTEINQHITTDVYNYSYDASNNLIQFTITTGTSVDIYKIVYANGVPSYATRGYSDTTFCTFTVQNNQVTGISYPWNKTSETITYSGNNVASVTQTPQTSLAPSYATFGTGKGPYKNSRFKWFLDIAGTSNKYMEYDANNIDTYGSSSSTAATVPITYNQNGLPSQITFGTETQVFTYTTNDED